MSKIIFDIEDCSFGDGSHAIHIAEVFDSKELAVAYSEKIKSALKLQELVKERLNPKLHTCYEGCTKCINFHYLQSLLEESEKWLDQRLIDVDVIAQNVWSGPEYAWGNGKDMTKYFHYCEKCKGINGIYVKICAKTGDIIEDYKEQYERIEKGLLDNRNFVEPDGSKQWLTI